MPSDTGARGTLPLYLATVATYADMYLTQPLLPELAGEFRAAPTAVATTVSAVVLAIAVASAFYGPLSERLGRKRIMTGAMALLAAATLAGAFAPSLPLLVTVRAAQGLLVPGVTAVSVAWAGARCTPRELPQVVGGIIGASVVGGLLGRVGAGWIAEHQGWRASFAAFAAPTLVAAAALGFGLPRDPPAPAARPGGAFGGLTLHFANRRVVGAWLAGAALFFGWIGLFTFLPFHLSAPPYALGTGLVSSVYLTYAPGAIVAPIVGRLSGRIPARSLMAGGLAVALAGVALTAARPLGGVVLGLTVMVVGTFAAQAVAPAWVNRAAREPKGGANALYVTFYYLGGTAGSVLPGLGWRAAGWTGVLLICGAAFAAGLAAVLLLCVEPDAAAEDQRSRGGGIV